MAVELGVSCGFVTARPTSDPDGSGTNFDSHAKALKVTAPAGATNVIEIGYYRSTPSTLDSGSTVGIYSHDTTNDKPDDLLGSADFTSTGGEGWRYAAVDIAISGGTTYWIGAQLDDLTLTCQLDYTADAGADSERKFTQTTLTDPWGTSSGTDAQYLAIYAVYETGGAGNIRQINIGDAWKEIAEVQINIGDSWKAVAGEQINIGDAWKTIF